MTAVVVLDDEALGVIVTSLRHAGAYYRTNGLRPPPAVAETLAALERHQTTKRAGAGVVQDAPYVPAAAVTIAEAARRLSCSERTVQRWCASGRLASFHLGRVRRVPVAAIEQLTQENI